MTNFNEPRETVSLKKLSNIVNSDNLGSEIVVFDQEMSLLPDNIYPARIDALLIAMCTQGSGQLGMDLRQYEIEPNTIIVIQPRNYINISSFSPEFRCVALACSQNVVEEIIPKLTDVLPLLMKNRAEPVTRLNDMEAERIKGYFTFIKRKLGEENTPFKRQKIMSLVQAAMFEMMEINLKNAPKVPEARTRKEEIMARFLLTVSEEFRLQRSVAYYAEKLCITPKHLSAVVKDISGRTAGDWIENYVIMEAKVMLKTTNLTVQEVSDALNFANQSFFGKYFRNHTGMSPTAYRKLYI